MYGHNTQQGKAIEHARAATPVRRITTQLACALHSHHDHVHTVPCATQIRGLLLNSEQMPWFYKQGKAPPVNLALIVQGNGQHGKGRQHCCGLGEFRGVEKGRLYDY